MIDVLFDQYQRYQNVTDIINSMRMPGQVFNILEVGANEHQNLEKFLPIDQITYLDIQLPEHLKNNPKYILGDATSMDFPDNHYNVVVALDVFEHIFENDRERFISELHRVSSNFFVITAPFHSPEVVEAERRVNEVYKSIFNKNFIWLEEHMMNGLPDLVKLSTFLRSQSIDYKIISHGDVHIWEKLMTIHFIAAQDSRLGNYRNEIDRFYNQHLFEIDFVEESYRKICVGTKKGNLSTLALKQIDPSKREKEKTKLDELEKTFYRLADLPIRVINDPPRDFIQIFTDEGTGYSETNSIKVTLNSGRQNIKANLELKRLRSIRIDPSNYKGSFQIKNIKVGLEAQDKLPKETYIITGNFNLNFKDTFVFYEDDPFIILNFSEEELVKEVSFDIIKLSQDEAPISIIDYFSEQIEIFREKARLKESEFEKQVSELSATNTQLLQANQSLNTELKNYKLSYDTARKTINEINQKDEELNQTNNELNQTNKELNRTIGDLQQTNSEILAELKSIHESRGWIYLTKLKRIIGR